MDFAIAEQGAYRLDISVETVHTLVPFSGIPIRIVQALTRQQKH
jgi:hypothetical protein